MNTVFFKKNFTRAYAERGENYEITAKAKITSLKNQYPYFSLTVDINRVARNGRRVGDSGGCLRDEIKKHFPKLEKYIRWHLVSVDEPKHYIANSLYWAGLQGWTDDKEDSPPRLDYLKSTCKWDDDDDGDDLPLRLLMGRGDKNSLINRSKAANLTKLLNKRKITVMSTFLRDMAELFGDDVYDLPTTWESRLR